MVPMRFSFPAMSAKFLTLMAAPNCKPFPVVIQETVWVSCERKKHLFYM